METQELTLHNELKRKSIFSGTPRLTSLFFRPALS